MVQCIVFKSMKHCSTKQLMNNLLGVTKYIPLFHVTIVYLYIQFLISASHMNTINSTNDSSIRFVNGLFSIYKNNLK